MDPRYIRPSDVDSLLGDAAYARKVLGWKPEISPKELCREMVAEDYKMALRLAKLNGSSD